MSENVDKYKKLKSVFDNYVDIESRSIFLGTGIDQPDEESDTDWRSWFTVGFRTLDAHSDAPIKLWLNTPGGDETGMYMAYDLIRTATSPIITIGIGEVASAGVLLLAAGHRRLVTENAVVMSHEGSGGMHSDLSASEIKSRMKWIKWLEENWCDKMALHTPKTAKEWARITSKEAELWLLGGAQIVEEGLADVVIPARSGELQKAILEAERFLMANRGV